MDVLDLREFYSSNLGRTCRRFLGRALREQVTNAKDARIVGLGYATPYLGLFREEAERLASFMPSQQGVVCWPDHGPCASALVYDDDLPLADSMLDMVLIVHALEAADNPARLLEECYRALAPGGTVMIVVPNRRGLWARFDNTPFGSGRPFSRSQLKELLRSTGFSPKSWSTALHFVPMQSRFAVSAAPFWEGIGKTAWTRFSGLLLVEATKQMTQIAPSKARRLKPMMRPVLAPTATAMKG